MSTITKSGRGRFFLAVFLTLGLGLGATRAAAADRYTFTTIDIPDVPGAFVSNIATGINNRGHIVLLKNGGSEHGYLFSNGSFWTFDVPALSPAPLPLRLTIRVKSWDSFSTLSKAVGVSVAFYSVRAGSEPLMLPG